MQVNGSCWRVQKEFLLVSLFVSWPLLRLVLELFRDWVVVVPFNLRGGPTVIICIQRRYGWVIGMVPLLKIKEQIRCQVAPTCFDRGSG